VNFETLGNLGDFVGGLAVIISVLYLAVQIRQNTRLLKATALTATTDSYLSFNRLLGGDPRSAYVFQVGLEDFESLSEGERRQFLNLLRLAFTSYQHVYHQYEKDLLDDEVWRQFLQMAAALLARPHIRAWWEARKGVFTPQFVREIDEAPEGTAPPLAEVVIEKMLRATEPRSS